MEQGLKHDMLVTMAVAISAGILLILLARRVNVSAIVLLLLGGIALGPQALGLVNPESLGHGLPVIVSLAVSLILFEGGLTLDVRGYRTASAMIKRLLTVGVLTTWLTTAAAIFLIFRTSISFSLLAASLVIVTGPTVIAPLLKRIKVTSSLHNVLHWEGVLIDPIGVFIALLCFEWVVDQNGGVALANLALRFLSGLGIGAAGGYILYFCIHRKWVPEDLLNVFALAGAVLIFGVTESLISEAGLLAVTVAGLVLGSMAPGELKQIRAFKAEITDLMVGMLFVLLAARLKFDQFQHFGLPGLVLVALVMFVVRPLNVLLSSWGLDLKWREKVFLGWVAPRGIVAASMGALLSLSLHRLGDPNAWFIETFTYSVIIATVLLQGFSAGPFARLLGLRRAEPTGWLVVGAHAFGREIARFIQKASSSPAVLIDSNPTAIVEARYEGLTVVQADARDTSVEDRHELQGVGNLLALTDNEDLNELLCQRWAELLGPHHVFRWKAGRKDAPNPQASSRAGAAVWPGLPKPSLLSAQLARGEAELLERTDGPPPGQSIPLVSVIDGLATLELAGPGASSRDRPAGRSISTGRWTTSPGASAPSWCSG